MQYGKEWHRDRIEFWKYKQKYEWDGTKTGLSLNVLIISLIASAPIYFFQINSSLIGKMFFRVAVFILLCTIAILFYLIIFISRCDDRIIRNYVALFKTE